MRDNTEKSMNTNIMVSGLEPFVKIQIIRNIRRYSAITCSIIILIVLKYASSDAQLISNLNFIGFSLLIWPQIWILLVSSAGNIRFKRWATSFITKRELDAIALSMILPTLSSSYRDLSIYSKIVFIASLFLIIGPLITQTINISLPLALLCYGLMLFRYIRCLYQINTCKFTISDNALNIPVLGFFNQYNTTLSFDDITEVTILGSRENIQSMTTNNDNEDSEVDLFMLGVRIYYQKTNVFIVSTALVPFDFLYTLVESISKYHGKDFKLSIQLISNAR